MSRYIDADKLKQDLDAWAINLHKPTNLVRDDTFVIIDEQPTADVVEVRHGHWIKTETNYQCSECCWWFSIFHNYCPNCGARMDGEEE